MIFHPFNLIELPIGSIAEFFQSGDTNSIVWDGTKVVQMSIADYFIMPTNIFYSKHELRNAITQVINEAHAKGKEIKVENAIIAYRDWPEHFPCEVGIGII